MRRSRFTRVATGALAVTSLVGFTVSPAHAAPTTQLVGEGESWALPALQQLQNDSSSKIAPLTPGYLDVGDAQARTDVAEGVADYASVGSPFTAAQLADAKKHGRSIAYVPYAFGAVAVPFAVDIDPQFGGGTVSQLQLTAGTLAKIFVHNISTWADTEILAENTDPASAGIAHADIPGILTVTRLDSSWSTAALVSYLLADPTAKPIWNAYAQRLGSAVDTPVDRWPADTFGGTLGVISGSIGVIDTMLQLDPATQKKKPAATTHHIAYLAPAWTTKFKAPVVALQNQAGKFVLPSSAGVSSAIAEAGKVDPATNVVAIDYTKITGAASYPIPMVEYLAVPTTGLSASKAKGLSSFIKYVLSDAGQKTVTDTGYTPITAALRTAGLKVAATLDAGAPTTTTSTSTSTSSTTSTTISSLGSTVPTGGGGGGGGSGGTGGLPRTGGGPPWALVIGATVVLTSAAAGRRYVRRART